MRTRRATQVACVIALLTGATVQAADPPPPKVPDHLLAAVQSAEDAGRQLQRLDRAGWIATDVIQADRSARKLRRAARGWITTAIDTGTRVIFHDDSEPARALYIVDVDHAGRSTTIEVPNEGTLDDSALALIRARNAAASESFLRCSPTYNTVVFRKDDAIHVYLMAATKRTGVFPAGGHHLFVFDTEGRTLRSKRAFTNGCIDLATPNAPSGHRLAFMAVTHLLDPHPTEIHAFISLNAPTPLVVATASDRSPDQAMGWKVENGQISLLFVPEG